MTKTSLADDPYFCILPWIHLYITPSSDVYPCCYGGVEQPIGNLLDNDLIDLANSDGIKAMRRRMMSGQPSRHCERCYKAEAAGFQTLRQVSNGTFHRYIENCNQTRADGHVDEFAFRYLDVRFSNICNLKCRFCWHGFSSSWYDDHKALDPNYDQPRFLKAGQSDEHLWSQIIDSLGTVDQIYFAGGEPLLMHEHYKILAYLDEASRYEVGLSYTTNLSVLAYKDQVVTDFWKKFQNVSVRFSLDGLGRRGEFIRKGSEWNNFIANIQEAQRSCPLVKLEPSLTINVLNIFDLISIYNYIENDPVFHSIPLDINFLDGPKPFSIQVLPLPIKYELTADLLDYAETAAEAGRIQDRDNVRAVVKFMNADDKSHLLPELFERSDRLDRLRDESIDETLPEIGQLRVYAEAKT